MEFSLIVLCTHSVSTNKLFLEGRSHMVLFSEVLQHQTACTQEELSNALYFEIWAFVEKGPVSYNWLSEEEKKRCLLILSTVPLSPLSWVWEGWMFKAATFSGFFWMHKTRMASLALCEAVCFLQPAPEYIPNLPFPTFVQLESIFSDHVFLDQGFFFIVFIPATPWAVQWNLWTFLRIMFFNV